MLPPLPPSAKGWGGGGGGGGGGAAAPVAPAPLFMLSPLQTNQFSVTNFHVASFICSSVRPTFPFFSMTSALGGKLDLS